MRVVYQGSVLTLPPWQARQWALQQFFLCMESAMIAFEVNDMTCGHCVSIITKAVKAADIKEAGYTPVPVQATSSDPVPAKQGSCCGCG